MGLCPRQKGGHRSLRACEQSHAAQRDKGSTLRTDIRSGARLRNTLECRPPGRWRSFASRALGRRMGLGVPPPSTTSAALADPALLGRWEEISIPSSMLEWTEEAWVIWREHTRTQA